MQNTKRNWSKRLGWAGIALCGLCCALPIIGTAVGMASLTALSFYLEKIGILALGIAAFFFWFACIRKGRKQKHVQQVVIPIAIANLKLQIKPNSINTKP